MIFLLKNSMFWGSLLWFVMGCDIPKGPKPGEEAEPDTFELSQAFKDYWYSGVAELTTFKLQQVRYGEIREGLATTIFVTEDFSKSRFVKLDYPGKGWRG